MKGEHRTFREHKKVNNHIRPCTRITQTKVRKNSRFSCQNSIESVGMANWSKSNILENTKCAVRFAEEINLHFLEW